MTIRVRSAPVTASGAVGVRVSVSPSTCAGGIVAIVVAGHTSTGTVVLVVVGTVVLVVVGTVVLVVVVGNVVLVVVVGNVVLVVVVGTVVLVVVVVVVVGQSGGRIFDSEAVAVPVRTVPSRSMVVPVPGTSMNPGTGVPSGPRTVSNHCFTVVGSTLSSVAASHVTAGSVRQ